MGGSIKMAEPVAGRSLPRPNFGFGMSRGLMDMFKKKPDLPYTYTVHLVYSRDSQVHERFHQNGGTGGGEVACPAQVWILDVPGSNRYVQNKARFAIYLHGAPGIAVVSHWG